MSKIIIQFPFKSFSSRVVESMVWAMIFVFVLTVVMVTSSNSNIGLLIGFCIFLFYLMENRSWGRFYITEVSRNSDVEIKIVYYDRDERKECTLNIKTMEISREQVWYKIRGIVSYISIKDKNSDFRIRQFLIGKWDETAFDLMLNIRNL